MHKSLIALAATTGFIGLSAMGASAAAVMPAQGAAQVSGIQQADWYCGPRCEYWHHRRWEEQRHRWWYEHHNHYYGYNYGYYGYPYYR